MDTLAHAVYGATLFSRTGLAGGRRRPRPRGRFDWTLWAAFGFGLLPDLASIGVFFAEALINGRQPGFGSLPPYVFVLYNATHSLLITGLALLLIRRLARPLVIPALAWPLHILMDIPTHARGRFQTPFLYPLSDYAFDGLNWWQHGWLVALYWGVLPLLWLGLHLARRRRAAREMSGVGIQKTFDSES